MPAESTTQLDAIDQRGLGVRVEFSRIGDRYAHVLVALRGDSAVPIVTSVAHADRDGWPLSPPVQELRTADASDGPVLLLMGAARQGHWSASVKSANHAVAGPHLEFDVAVRLSEAPSYLGVAYDACPEARWIDLPQGISFPQLGDAALSITASLDDVVAAATRPSQILRVTPDGAVAGRRVFEPEFSLTAGFPTTVRWRYWVGLALGPR